jgi:glycosyltransferase involved in cell wall biosynthesis
MRWRRQQREVVSGSLLETASLGKPIITTDAVGCRDVVDDGINGFLCKPRDAEDLADKMLQMIGLSEGQRLEMGRRGRAKMLREFDERIVIDRYLAAIEEILVRRSIAEVV